MTVLLCDEFATGPNYATDARDVVYFNGTKLPGVGWVDCKPGRLIDVKKPHGGDGGRMSAKGWECRPVVVTIRYWTRDQEQILWEEIDKVWAPPGKSPRTETTSPSGVKTKPAVDIDHPNCARLHVTAFEIQEIQAPKQAPEGRGVWLLQITGLQYFDPKGNTERKVRGAGHQLTAKAQAIKNALGSDPATTEGLPKKPIKPSQGIK